MRIPLFTGLLLSIACPVAAQDSIDRTQDERRTPVAWIERPSPDEIRAALPAAALERGLSGEVALSCTVTTDGVARDCYAREENPEGLGFGAAAILLSRQFLFRPATLDGVPIESTMSTTIRFEFGSARGGFVSRQSYVVAPRWLAAPSRADMDVAFPDPERGEEGRAVLDCRVGRNDGRLDNCRTLSEVPDGRGFARAARQLTGRFQLALSEDMVGQNLRVQVPFHFDLPGTPGGDDESSMMTNPDWRSLPDAPAVLETFPALARSQGIAEGRVSVSCRIQTDGTTADCVAQQADPPNVGFEAAATTLASLFAINPWSADGRPYQGERVRIPFRFIDPLTASGDEVP